jgi:aspartate/tyrosine/aromatic aminotransferase
MQTISGTGALFLGFYFISNFLPQTPKTVYVSDPTWPTHHDVIQTSGLKVDTYPYYDSEANSFNFEKMI